MPNVFFFETGPGGGLFGLGYKRLARESPIVLFHFGFGQKGRTGSDRYDPILHAGSGLDLGQVDTQGEGRPGNTAASTPKCLGGRSALAAIKWLVSPVRRPGRGQYIDVALLDCMLNILVSECQEAQAPSKRGTRVYPPLKTRDGYVVVAPTSHKNFEQLTRVVGHPEWLGDTRFTTSGTREKNWSELMDLIEEWTRERSGQEVESLLMAGGVPCTRYKSVSEAMADPQLQARGALTRIEDDAGAYWVPNAPFQMPGLNTSPRANVPGLGESTVDVLRDVLGYSASEAKSCSGDLVRA